MLELLAKKIKEPATHLIFSVFPSSLNPLNTIMSKGLEIGTFVIFALGKLNRRQKAGLSCYARLGFFS